MLLVPLSTRPLVQIRELTRQVMRAHDGKTFRFELPPAFKEINIAIFTSPMPCLYQDVEYLNLMERRFVASMQSVLDSVWLSEVPCNNLVYHLIAHMLSSAG